MAAFRSPCCVCSLHRLHSAVVRPVSCTRSRAKRCSRDFPTTLRSINDKDDVLGAILAARLLESSLRASEPSRGDLILGNREMTMISYGQKTTKYRHYNSELVRSASAPPVVAVVAKRMQESSKANVKRKKSSWEKASPTQLSVAFFHLREELPVFFQHGHNVGLYSKNVVFENSLILSSCSTRGRFLYRCQLALFRWAARLRFGTPTMDVLKATKQVNESSIHVRWRVSGRSKDNINTWDGYSVFEVGGDGLIRKHRISRVLPSQDELKSPSSASKLALAIVSVIGLSKDDGWVTSAFSSSKVYRNLTNAEE
ncbi:uncharacterized protein [Oscarella lobularis]|uniref:uncharacterized protein n=1 Tax=Oscarella lobularis TaxID=121494 RepID=UPI003313C225